MNHIPLSLSRLEAYYSLNFQSNAYNDCDTSSTNSFGFSSFFSMGGGRNSYDVITDNIIVGVMPRRFPTDPKIKMVVSVSTYDELTEANIPEDVEQVFLHIPDRTAHVSNEDALDVVLQIDEFLKTHPDEKVLIHCQSGVGRSVMICASVLALFPEDAKANRPIKNAGEGFGYVIHQRSGAKAESDKLQRANEIVALYREQREKYEHAPEAQIKDIPSYLASLEGKDAIRRLRKFIQLGTFGRDHLHDEYGSAIGKFFNTILHSEDGKWYDDLCQNQGVLFDARLDNAQFRNLVDGFKQQLNLQLVKRTDKVPAWF